MRFSLIRHVCNLSSKQGIRQFATTRPTSSKSSNLNFTTQRNKNKAEEEIANEIYSDVELDKFDQVEKTKLFALSKESLENYISEGVSKHVQELFEFSDTPHLLLREPTKEILSVLKTWPQKPENFPKAVVFDGRRGTGKSVALTQVVEYARRNNWIVFHIPKARNECHDGIYVQRSIDDPNKYDIPSNGVKLLIQFYKQHMNQLDKLPIRTNLHPIYDEPSNEVEYPKAQNLGDLIKRGIECEELSCQVLQDLRNELAEITEYNVLIAVDEYNTWFQDTAFGLEGKSIKAQDLSIVETFKHMDKNGFREERALKNGLFVCATTDNYRYKESFRDQVNYRAERKTLYDYTDEELDVMLKNYINMDLIQEPETVEAQPTHFRLMTMGNPLNVFNRASYI